MSSRPCLRGNDDDGEEQSSSDSLSGLTFNASAAGNSPSAGTTFSEVTGVITGRLLGHVFWGSSNLTSYITTQLRLPFRTHLVCCILNSAFEGIIARSEKAG